MGTLFTVDYALKYEGWTLNLCKAPYGWYLVNELSINVRRNDFYLRLFVYDLNNNLVYTNVIPTIDDYKKQIKRNIFKWKGTKKSTKILLQEGCSVLLEDGNYLIF